MSLDFDEQHFWKYVGGNRLKSLFLPWLWDRNRR